MKTQNRAAVSNFQVLSNSSISHLEQACKASVHVYSRLSMEFPHSQYNRILELQAKDHILFILKTLKSIEKIYSGKYEKVDCDQRKLQIFLLDVHRQIFELERCENIVPTKVLKKILKNMEIHFRGLISHLKITDFSAEGWGETAGVVLQHLRRLDLLATKTKIELHDH
ncbi:interferon a3-like [Silurus meridionalis]|uniref:interferon a3-like n=1 Tax=Silurus meridionalis TaxID=175797 RepID=UPI001EEC669F|nr:interferon a3-like [Silurus meridionalis]